MKIKNPAQSAGLIICLKFDITISARPSQVIIVIIIFLKFVHILIKKTLEILQGSVNVMVKLNDTIPIQMCYLDYLKNYYCLIKISCLYRFDNANVQTFFN